MTPDEILGTIDAYVQDITLETKGVRDTLQEEVDDLLQTRAADLPDALEDFKGIIAYETDKIIEQLPCSSGLREWAEEISGSTFNASETAETLLRELEGRAMFNPTEALHWVQEALASLARAEDNEDASSQLPNLVIMRIVA